MGLVEKYGIRLEDTHTDEENGTTDFYFKADKHILDLADDEYPDAVSAEICMECPTGSISAKTADIRISPTNSDNSDYDWGDIDLTFKEKDDLVTLVMNNCRFEVFMESTHGVRMPYMDCDSEQEAVDFCESHDWKLADENNFEWGLDYRRLETEKNVQIQAENTKDGQLRRRGR